MTHSTRTTIIALAAVLVTFGAIAQDQPKLSGHPTPYPTATPQEDSGLHKELGAKATTDLESGSVSKGTAPMLIAAARSGHVKNRGQPSEATLMAAGTDSSMCQGDYVSYGNFADAGFQMGSLIINELDPVEFRNNLIRYGEASISRNLRDARKAEEADDMVAARQHTKAAEFYECHRANNWPTVNWMVAVLNFCLPRASGTTDRGEKFTIVNQCATKMAMKYNRMALTARR